MTTPQKRRSHTTQKNNRNTKATKRRVRSRKRNLFRRLPSHLLWGLLSVVIVIYIYFLYTTFVGPYSFRWKAIYGEVTYPEGSVRGIDISHYQENIDWDRLRNATLQDSPVQFIFIKATEGTDKFDSNFNQNFFYARKNGIIRGAYHFFSTQSSARKQAEFFCRMVQLDEGDLPPVLDVETEVDHIDNYSSERLKSEVLEWMRIVEKHYGITPILYASHSFRLHYLNDPDFEKYPFWIAHYYVSDLKYKGKWAFWQHTDVGHVDGIDGYVDIDLFNGTAEELADMCLKEIP